MFPFCAAHLAELKKLPRRRTCAGAMATDHGGRKTQVNCSNDTPGPADRLCEACERLERRVSPERTHCNHCGQSLPKKEVALVPERMSFGRR